MADPDNSIVDVVKESADPLGAWIREARESKNLSAAAVAEALRLDKHIVEKLEAEQFSELGALVFVKGHLRAIANHLGLDTEEAMRRFQASPEYVSEEVPALIVSYNSAVSRRPSNAVLLFGAGAVVAALLALAAWIFWPSGTINATPDSVAATDGNASPGVAGAPTTGLPSSLASEALTTAPPPSSTVVPTTITPSDESREQGQAAVDQAGLRLVFSGTCWFEVRDANDRRVAYGTATANTERTITGTRPLRVTLGVANVVAVFVDGEPYTIAAEERRGRAARLTIN